MLVFACLAIIALSKEYVGVIMLWFSNQHGWYGPLLFGLMFIIVSLPMTWGYLVLNIGAGYLYGFQLGSIVTSLSSTIGCVVSFRLCRLLWKDYVNRTLSSYDNLLQLVRVIEGRQGFRIIMMTRLTPIPFGVQNALLSVR